MSALQLRSASEGAEVLGVSWDARIVTVVVVPYEQPTPVEHRGEVWTETFARGAFDDTLKNVDPTSIRVNRGHDKTKTIGKVVAFRPNDPRGLVADIRIANTALGDDSLGLAAEGCLSASIGAYNRPSGVISDRYNRTRRVVEAFIDHVALVENPAYVGAEVLAVRSRSAATPNLDSVANKPIFAWAEQRLDPVHRWARKRLGC
ncbi:HK97 family phage prohead protease [Mycobacterium sp. 3-98]|uniref:HK97 family phage prohead protease n=1 Tax=Mycobacterium sp. 3-98 TaxID=3042317 RepID=UPI002DDA6DE6|nr:HK97 family phage prohead protease [Mycobacterium sp. 3-98]WSE45584.1 HK97 family phage prohead protease [Mycobacterium sp. 3-98]